jgi:hypothetical protein
VQVIILVIHFFHTDSVAPKVGRLSRRYEMTFHGQKCTKLTAVADLGAASSSPVTVVTRAFDFMASRAFFLTTRGSPLFAARSVAVRLRRGAEESAERDIVGICLWMDLDGLCIHKTSCFYRRAEANLVTSTPLQPRLSMPARHRQMPLSH